MYGILNTLLDASLKYGYVMQSLTYCLSSLSMSLPVVHRHAKRVHPGTQYTQVNVTHRQFYGEIINTKYYAAFRQDCKSFIAMLHSFGLSINTPVCT